MLKTPSMARLGIVLVALGGVASLHAAGRPATSSAPAGRQATGSAAAHRAVLDRYCVTCHNERLRTADLSLETANLDEVGEDAEIWEKVLVKLRARTMPPPQRPRPEPATYEAFASWLETAVDGVAAAHPNPGRPTVRRLNRTEYANAVRDLLAVEVDGDALLPADDMAYGFDNNADMQRLSSGLLERYMSAASRISRLAVGDMTIRPGIETYTVSLMDAQAARASEALPFGTRAGRRSAITSSSTRSTSSGSLRTRRSGAGCAHPRSRSSSRCGSTASRCMSSRSSPRRSRPRNRRAIRRSKCLSRSGCQ